MPCPKLLEDSGFQLIKGARAHPDRQNLLEEAMLGISKLIVLVTCLSGFAQSAYAQSGSAAPVGSWRGSVVSFELGSDGKFSYKDAETAKLTGSWQWRPTTQIGGVLDLTSAASASPKALKFAITWMNKNTLRFCNVDDHCDTLSRQ